DPSGLQGPGMGYFQNLDYEKKAAAQRSRKEIADADSKVAKMIDDMHDLPTNAKAEVKQGIQLLLDQSRFDWPYTTGAFGKCYLWVDEYLNRTQKLRSELGFTQNLDKYFQVYPIYW